MREFRCESMGNKCAWRHIATEELLADMVALHLRDVHGVQAIDQETVGRIKKLFTYPSEADAAAAVDLVLKEYHCERGPECSWRYIAMSEDLIAEEVAKHVRERHGTGNITREMMARIRSSIHRWGGDKDKKAA